MISETRDHMARFLLADDRITPFDGYLVVARWLPGVTVIECTEGHIASQKAHEFFTFIGADGVMQEWTLSVAGSGPLGSVDGDAVKPYLKKAWRWFKFRVLDNRNLQRTA